MADASIFKLGTYILAGGPLGYASVSKISPTVVLGLAPGDALIPKINVCLIAPTGSVTLEIRVGGTPIGSMNIASSSTTATWTLSSTYTAAAGDIFGFYAPSPVDATLSGLHYTFVGIRT